MDCKNCMVNIQMLWMHIWTHAWMQWTWEQGKNTCRFGFHDSFCSCHQFSCLSEIFISFPSHCRPPFTVSRTPWVTRSRILGRTPCWIVEQEGNGHATKKSIPWYLVQPILIISEELTIQHLLISCWARWTYVKDAPVLFPFSTLNAENITKGTNKLHHS